MQKLSKYKNSISTFLIIKRYLWFVVWIIFIRPFPRKTSNRWYRLLLIQFGAKVHKDSTIYAKAKIYMPWNLEIGENSCISEYVDCYNVDKVIIGHDTVISQKSYLCTASHDIYKETFPLITGKINIGNYVWIGADAFVGMNIDIGDNSVIGARAVVVKDVESNSIVGGNPAKHIKWRKSGIEKELRD